MKNMRLKFLFLICAGLTAAASASAQVQCTLALDAAKPLKAGDHVTAKLNVEIDPGWHISSLTTPDNGPLRSEIALPKGSPCKLAGKIEAPKPRREHSKAFDVDVETYEGAVEFTVPLEATQDLAVGSKIVVEFTYQACNDETCNLPKTYKAEATVGLRVDAK